MTASTRQGNRCNISPSIEHSITYDHRLRIKGHPVRSAILKPQIGRLVVEWVTISESLLLYVFLLAFFCTPAPSCLKRDLKRHYQNLENPDRPQAILLEELLAVLPPRDFPIQILNSTSNSTILQATNAYLEKPAPRIVFPRHFQINDTNKILAQDFNILSDSTLLLLTKQYICKTRHKGSTPFTMQKAVRNI